MGRHFFADACNLYTLQKECFWGYTTITVCVSVCVPNTSSCQGAGGGIKSHLVTALVSKSYSHSFSVTCVVIMQKTLKFCNISVITGNFYFKRGPDVNCLSFQRTTYAVKEKCF